MVLDDTHGAFVAYPGFPGGHVGFDWHFGPGIMTAMAFGNGFGIGIRHRSSL